MSQTAAPALTGTLAKPDVARLLSYYNAQHKSADTLLKLFMSNKVKEADDAVLDGQFALHATAATTLELLRNCGGLLFAWQGSKTTKDAQA